MPMSSKQPLGFTLAFASVIAAVPIAPAAAQTFVPFNGTVVASCVLTVSTSGMLGISAESGTEMGSELAGGSAAILGIVATAGRPTISFTAPTMSQQPAGYTGTPVVSLRYTSPGGANQSYTSGSSQYTSTNALGDTVTLNAKATDSSGFAAGAYRLQTTATCQQ